MHSKEQNQIFCQKNRRRLKYLWCWFYEHIADLPGATLSTSAEHRGCQLKRRNHKRMEEPFSHGPLWKLDASKTVLAAV